MQPEHIHFVTGRLAEPSLRRHLKTLAPQVGFQYTIDVLNITVAALMTPAWVASRLQVPAETDRILLPGYCQGDLAPVETVTGLPVERGPRDLRRLAEFFGKPEGEQQYGDYEIEILAEINHAPQWKLTELLSEARRLRESGADLIDVGCNPGENWSEVGKVVKALRDEGHRVSIDSLNPREIEPAVQAGAELVLSVNSGNREAAPDWGCEVVVIPDDPKSKAGLDETIEFLANAKVPLRIDPVLEPIGFGFAPSLGRYLEVRRRYPDAEMMMGIGNLTELTDVDSAGVNVMLLGICEELGIRSVLTTQVINWARSSVRECDLGRRLVHHAVHQQTLPKHLEPRLVMLRDAKLLGQDPEELEQLSANLKDNNYRLFSDGKHFHLVGANLHLEDSDPFGLFEKLMSTNPKNLDPGHAFYLGFELSKALTANTLGKQYEQDEPLDWGFLTVPENLHRLQRKKTKSRGSGEDS